jgi:hypothetical protein
MGRLKINVHARKPVKLLCTHTVKHLKKNENPDVVYKCIQGTVLYLGKR